jgi:hypothetical protein
MFHKDKGSLLPRVNPTVPPDAFNQLEKFLEGAFNRFEHRMERMIGVMEYGFENLNNTHTKTLKRLGKIYLTMDRMASHICVDNNGKSSDIHNRSREHSVEDSDQPVSESDHTKPAEEDSSMKVIQRLAPSTFKHPKERPLVKSKLPTLSKSQKPNDDPPNSSPYIQIDERQPIMSQYDQDHTDRKEESISEPLIDRKDSIISPEKKPILLSP